MARLEADLVLEATAPRTVVVGGTHAGRVLLADFPQLEVFGSVVGAVPVDVVDPFVRFEKPAELPFHDETVFWHRAFGASSWMVRSVDVEVPTTITSRAAGQRTGYPSTTGDDVIGSGCGLCLWACPSGHEVLGIFTPSASVVTSYESLGESFEFPSTAVGLFSYLSGFAAPAFAKSRRLNPVNGGDESLPARFTGVLEVVGQVSDRLVPMMRFSRDGLAAPACTDQFAHTQSIA